METRDQAISDDVRTHTWESVEAQLQRRIGGAWKMIHDYRQMPDLADRAEAGIRQRLLDPLNRLVPVVEEMRGRPEFQSLSPGIGHELLSMLAPGLGSFTIEGLGEGRYRLFSWAPGLGSQTICEGGMSDVLERLARLIA